MQDDNVSIDPIDPARRRVLQGALSMAFGLIIPGGYDALRISRRPMETPIHLNQVGFLPTEPKRAIVPAESDYVDRKFAIVNDDDSHSIRFVGVLSEYAFADAEQYGHYPRHFFADFDGFRQPGRYRVRLSNGRQSLPFPLGRACMRGSRHRCSVTFRCSVAAGRATPLARSATLMTE